MNCIHTCRSDGYKSLKQSSRKHACKKFNICLNTYLFSLPLKCLILIQESRKYTSLGEDYRYAAKRSGNILIFLFKVFDATVKSLKKI